MSCPQAPGVGVMPMRVVPVTSQTDTNRPSPSFLINLRTLAVIAFILHLRLLALCNSSKWLIRPVPLRRDPTQPIIKRKTSDHRLGHSYCDRDWKWSVNVDAVIGVSV